MTQKLAIHGGPRAVTLPYHEKWRKIPWSFLIPILRHVYRDINTIASGSGPIHDFEKKWGKLCGTRYNLLMNSGTATLHSAFFAVGVKPGHEVIVPAYTFFASAAPVLQCGGKLVFCEVDPKTLTADPDDVERRITPKTRAICVVHVWGNPGRMDRFVEIGKRHNVAIIEDCSHGPGATYQGKPVGSWGDIGCFSLQGTKAVSGGELGIAVTNNPVYYDHMLALGHYGRVSKGQAAHTFEIDGLCLGLKYRPNLFGVLLALESMKRLKELNERRRRNYQILCDELRDCKAVHPIEAYPEAVRGGLLEFILRFHPEHAGGWNREAFILAAKAEGVPIAVDRYAQCGQQCQLLHDTPIFTTLDMSVLGGYLGNGPLRPDYKAHRLPVSEQLANELMTMPALTLLPEEYVRQCAQGLRKVAEVAASTRDPRLL